MQTLVNVKVPSLQNAQVQNPVNVQVPSLRNVQVQNPVNVKVPMLQNVKVPKLQNVTVKAHELLLVMVHHSKRAPGQSRSVGGPAAGLRSPGGEGGESLGKAGDRV